MSGQFLPNPVSTSLSNYGCRAPNKFVWLLILGLLATVAAAALTLAPITDTTEAALDGAAMRLSINSQTGTVDVWQNDTFTVVVRAESIPLQLGYIGAQVWVDLGDTGLTPKKNPWSLWPDCEPATFLTGQSGNAENAACLTGLINPAPSLHKGPLFSFDATCDKGPDPETSTSHTITLRAHGDIAAGDSGSAYHEFSTEEVIPAEHVDDGVGNLIADSIKVNCVSPLPTKQPEPFDTDGDGCSDQRENGPDETLGGLRNHVNPWDFYDVAVGGGGSGSDRVIDLSNDILGVIDHYAPSGEFPYDAHYDRGPSAGPQPWNMTAPDGVIDLSNDILGVIAQYNHNCT